MAFESVARLEDVPSGRGHHVAVAGLPVALFRVGDTVYAMEDRCPHADARLSGGSLEGCVVICPVHGWDFDVRTGFKPDDADGFAIPCYAVRIEAGEVFVDVEDEINHPRRGRRGEVSPA
ncbi:MAG: Rieske 2Fe-2S domain-containing protein [Myxococcota bacterium]|jgi:nitrite reductase/ring-hydroxylating ferredoxin subunit|nr:Rieske 2Fe-2S domain-containing protein [Myxococcota bacterium]